MKLKTKFAGGLLAATLGLGAMQSSAAMITDWNFSVTGNWDVPTVVYGAGSGCTSSSGLLLSWGACGVGTAPVDGTTPNNSRSGLEIEASPVTGSIMTNGGPMDTIKVTHFNNEIAGAFSTLVSADFLSSLTLTPVLPFAGPDVGPVSQTVPIQFRETPNVTNCGFASVTNCDDIFVLTLGQPVFSFTLDGFVYTTVIGATNLGPLPDTTCTSAGVATGCFGLTTPEFATTPVQFNFSISARPEVPVPVPATLALMGLGLLGFGALARRRRS